MKEAGKSLGEFVADVLSSVNRATYIPAAVVVSAVALIGLLSRSSDASPISAVANSNAPTFAELALFVIVVAVVAAILEPVQFWIARLFEGYSKHFPDSWTGAHVAERTRLDDAREAGLDKRDSLEAKFAALPKDHPERAPIARQLEALRRSISELSRQLDRWPQTTDRILPTRLGNLVRSYEDRAAAVIAETAVGGRWPSPFPSTGGLQDLLPFAYFAIPEATREQHDRFRNQLQASLLLTSILPVIGLGLACTIGAWPWIMAALAVSAALTATAFAGAFSAADGYGTMMLAIARQYAAGVITPGGNDESVRSTQAS